MDSYSKEAVAAAAGCSPEQLASWTNALKRHGLPMADGQLPVEHAVAVAAAVRFSHAGINSSRVKAVFELLLRKFPEGDDWLVVDRRNRAVPIAIEKAPFGTGKPLTYNNRIPIVFDPITFLERLDR